MKRVWDGAVEPAMLMVGCEDAPLGMVPPFLKERERVIDGGVDVLKAVWANRIGEILCGGVGGGIVG